MDKTKWEYKQWKDVLNIINGRDYKEVESIDGAYPICGSGGEIGRASEYLCPENTVIIGRKGNINKPLFITEKFWNIDTAFGLVANTLFLIPRFLFYFCIYYDFNRHNKAVTIPSLTKGDLLKIRMLIPPLPDQQRIVSELDCLNEMIALKQEQLKEFDKLAQSIFYDMFGRKGEETYSEVPLGEVCVIERGGSPRPIKDYITEAPDGYNWIKIGDAEPGSIYINHTKERIRKEGVKKSRKVYVGDFILSNSMSFGRPYILNIDGCIHDGWLVIHDEHHVFNKLYLYYFLSADETYKIFEKMAVGGVVNNLNSNLVKGLKVKIPPLPLQQQFAEKIEAIEQQKELVKQSMAETQKLLDYTMDKYFE